MRGKQCQQHLKASSWKSQEGWGGGCTPLNFLPSSPQGFIVPRESCGGVGVPRCAKCLSFFFFFLWLQIHCDCYSLAAEIAESMRDLLRCRERQEFLRTEYTGGRQSEPSKCDSVGPSRHRQTKKENPHGCTWKPMNTQRFNKKRKKKYYIHKDLHAFSLPLSLALTYTQWDILFV